MFVVPEHMQPNKYNAVLQVRGRKGWAAVVQRGKVVTSSSSLAQ
jgi:hypothetical protein